MDRSRGSKIFPIVVYPRQGMQIFLVVASLQEYYSYPFLWGNGRSHRRKYSLICLPTHGEVSRLLPCTSSAFGNGVYPKRKDLHLRSNFFFHFGQNPGVKESKNIFDSVSILLQYKPNKFLKHFLFLLLFLFAEKLLTSTIIDGYYIEAQSYHHRRKN